MRELNKPKVLLSWEAKRGDYIYQYRLVGEWKEQEAFGQKDVFSKVTLEWLSKDGMHNPIWTPVPHEHGLSCFADYGEKLMIEVARD